MSELQQEQSAAGAEYKMPERLANPAQTLEQSVAKLAKMGGFDFVENAVEGTQNLNPERKARKKIFLTDAEKKGEREALKKKLLLWMNMLNESGSIDEMVQKCNAKSEEAATTLKKNLKKALDATRELETNYRSLALFYKNTESDKLKNVTIMNASMEQLKDLDNTRFIDYVEQELKANYDRLDLRDNYSIMCVPGYLGSNKVVEKWAKIAHNNKVMMVTDFENLDTCDDVVDMFESANLAGGDIYKSNVVMASNWLVGRAKNQEVGEEDEE